MASKSFNLADAPEGGGKSGCAKFGLCTCLLGFLGVLGLAAVYVYQTYGECSSPELDEYGLSNWTHSSNDLISFGCFPGYFLEGESNLQVSKCVDGSWTPLPPACNSLPIRIDCHVHNQSLTGNISMWQESAEAPTHIFGLINYSDAMKPQGHVTENVIISKKTCNVSHIIPSDISELDPEHIEPKPLVPMEDEEEFNSTISTPPTPTSLVEEEDTTKARSRVVRVHFLSKELKAYKKTEIFFNIIFVDSKTTATLVSVHQHNLTLVQTNSNPIHSLNATWNWDKETKAALKNFEDMEKTT